MNIEILQLVDGSRKAKGLAVIIDVFRAFSLECYISDQGAREIIAVGDIEVAYKYKSENPGTILIGERNERKPVDFDYGNSPAQLLGVDFTGKTIIHSTSAGTQGLVNATHADEIITGSFVNANAIIRYIKNKEPEIVSLVCMGYSALYPTEEDTFCAEYIRNSLLGLPNDIKDITNRIKQTSGQRLFEAKNQAHSPEKDFYLCMDLGKFDFVLKAEQGQNGLTKLRKIDC
jgi:2-phosphosulfolactate phosphatase